MDLAFEYEAPCGLFDQGSEFCSKSDPVVDQLLGSNFEQSRIPFLRSAGMSVVVDWLGWPWW